MKRLALHPRADKSLAVAGFAFGICALICATGRFENGSLAFGIIAAAIWGVRSGPGRGALAGLVVLTPSLPTLARQAGSGIAELNDAISWAALFPLTGFAMGLAAHVINSPNTDKVVDQERRKIARDLHDGVAQTLAHLRLELDMLSHPDFARSHDGNPESIARLARVAERTLTDVRGIINNLTPPVPTGGLTAGLASYVSDVASDHGPRIVLRSHGEIPEHHPAGAQLFRIAQEAISNAVRHAHSMTVEVTLERVIGGGIRLIIEDDGNGLPPNADDNLDPLSRSTVTESAQIPVESGALSGLGLPGMRERAAAIGGLLQITTPSRGGTRIEVTAPPPLMRIA